MVSHNGPQSLAFEGTRTGGALRGEGKSLILHPEGQTRLAAFSSWAFFTRGNIALSQMFSLQMNDGESKWQPTKPAKSL
jgi:hypothetical protein